MNLLQVRDLVSIVLGYSRIFLLPAYIDISWETNYDLVPKYRSNTKSFCTLLMENFCLTEFQDLSLLFESHQHAASNKFVLPVSEVTWLHVGSFVVDRRLEMGHYPYWSNFFLQFWARLQCNHPTDYLQRLANYCVISFSLFENDMPFFYKSKHSRRVLLNSLMWAGMFRSSEHCRELLCDTKSVCCPLKKCHHFSDLICYQHKYPLTSFMFLPYSACIQVGEWGRNFQMEGPDELTLCISWLQNEVKWKTKRLCHYLLNMNKTEYESRRNKLMDVMQQAAQLI